ncbi:MAG: IclR family transcriptional regulator [Syntrophaceae bacterium]|nr:IclR family transcriptional regulator [Syntrophaceae bacterium]
MLKNQKKVKSIYKPLVPAVEQASRILLFLGEGPQYKMKLTEICRGVGIHKSKGHSILNTLKQFGFVEKNPEGKTYSLGPAFIFLARHVLNNLQYPEIVAPFLENLAKDTNGTALFGLIYGDHLLVVGKREGNQNIGFSIRLGHRFHMTLGAHGKAIAAFMPEADRERLLAKKKVYFHGLDPSRLNLKRLREELTRCKQLGYAQDVGEITAGVNFISAPVFGLQEKIIGCIILIGTFAETLIEQYGPKTADVARRISYRLGANVKNLYPVG